MTETRETERLVIRRFDESDWRDLHEYLSEKRAVEFEPYGTFDEDNSRKEAARRAGSSDFWAVCLKETGKLIGNIYLSERNFGTWELGYVFNPAYWRNGYASEAARNRVDYAFKDRKAHRVTAMCNPINTASWKLMEKLGMRREGHLIKNIYFKTDENGLPLWSDTYEYAVLYSEWTE